MAEEATKILLLDIDKAGSIDGAKLLSQLKDGDVLSVWSSHLGEPDMPSRIYNELITKLQAVPDFESRRIVVMLAPAAKPEGEHVTELVYKGSTSGTTTTNDSSGNDGKVSSTTSPQRTTRRNT